jgi:hypothetical protein
MSKYEIYQTGKLEPLTIVEADKYTTCFNPNIAYFMKNFEEVACFNLDNISGIKKVEEHFEIEVETE